MNLKTKTVVLWLGVVIVGALLWQAVRSDGHTASAQEISYSDFLSQVEAGRVATVRISDNQVDGKYHDGKTFRVTVPSYQGAMIETLRERNVDIWFAASKTGFTNWLAQLAPLVLLGALWWVMIRTMRKASAKALDKSPTTSDARLPGQ